MEQYVEIRRKIKEKKIEFVQLEAIDLCGTIKCLFMNSESFIYGLPSNFHMGSPSMLMLPDGKGVDGTGLTFEINNPNAKLAPELETFKSLPWLQNTASIFCDLDIDHIEYFQTSCRQQCKKQLRKMEALGYRFFSSFEYEFYLVDKDTLKPVYEESNWYSEEHIDRIRPFIQDVMSYLQKTGIQVEAFTSEDGPAQQELTMKPTFGIQASDNAMLFKKAVKSSAQKHHMKALFMTQPFEDHSHCSSHFNHSIWQLSKKENAFSQINKDDKLSDICKYWIAGLQHHSKALPALYWATNNCVEKCLAKDSQDSYFVPSNNTWGYDHRGVRFRIKNYSPSCTYIEDRLPGAGCNPYLVTTGCLIAGMDGINRKLPLKSEAFFGNILEAAGLPLGAEKVPESLEKAIEYLKEDQVFVNELGDVFMKAFTALKTAEFQRWDGIQNVEERFAMYRQKYGMYL
ncbi:lengsin-like [Clytia hemisphaerica]|uniref:lengsin-like n=1 Tax=Clytia hemisphaerica TaxID=252671 RepID=UPI0034D3A3F5